MDKFLLAYIKQRMKERGICHFHYEPVAIVLNGTPIQANAYNEYYYTTGENIPNGMKIISDTNVFIPIPTSLAVATSSGYRNIQEFSGLINIIGGSLDTTYVVEFIHVVPTCKENFCVKRVCCEGEKVKGQETQQENK
jgi:hypothetical protein